MPQHVSDIRRRLKRGEKLLHIASSIGTSRATVRSIRDGKTWVGDSAYRSLKPVLGTDFYLYFFFSKNANYDRRSAHRTIWEAFHGKIPDGIQINHKDLDRENNALKNLELTTPKENTRHALNMYGVKTFRGVRGKYYGR